MFTTVEIVDNDASMMVAVTAAVGEEMSSQFFKWLYAHALPTAIYE